MFREVAEEVIQQPLEAVVIQAIPGQGDGGCSREVASGRLAEIHVGDRERIGVRESGAFDIGAHAGPVELVDVMPVVSLPEVDVAVEIAPATSTQGGTPHEPLDLAD